MSRLPAVGIADARSHLRACAFFTDYESVRSVQTTSAIATTKATEIRTGIGSGDFQRGPTAMKSGSSAIRSQALPLRISQGVNGFKIAGSK
jgi:hypothetical protein